MANEKRIGSKHSGRASHFQLHPPVAGPLLNFLALLYKPTTISATVSESVTLPISIMAELSVKLTPPARGTQEARMAPREYLMSSQTCTRIRNEMQLNDFDPRCLRLDPSPTTEDITIDNYQTRVVAQLQNDRRELQVMLPVGDQWKAMNERQNVSAIQYWLMFYHCFQY
jgi:hypothetical protein